MIDEPADPDVSIVGMDGPVQPVAPYDTQAVSPPPPPQPTRRARHRHWLIEWVAVVVVAAACAFVVRTYVVQQFKVEGSSMRDTLHSGDRVLVNKLSYRLHDPRRGDVIVLEPKTAGKREDLIKRVVGLPGESVEMGADCVVKVNDQPLEETYLTAAAHTPGECGSTFDPVSVPTGHVFVLGDNRGNSLDSRSKDVGVVPFDRIVGRAFVVIWPRADWRWL